MSHLLFPGGILVKVRSEKRVLLRAVVIHPLTEVIANVESPENKRRVCTGGGWACPCTVQASGTGPRQGSLRALLQSQAWQHFRKTPCRRPWKPGRKGALSCRVASLSLPVVVAAVLKVNEHQLLLLQVLPAFQQQDVSCRGVGTEGHVLTY